MTIITVGGRRCDATCQCATGRACNCVCGGRFHGAAHRPGGVRAAVAEADRQLSLDVPAFLAGLGDETVAEFDSRESA